LAPLKAVALRLLDFTGPIPSVRLDKRYIDEISIHYTVFQSKVNQFVNFLTLLTLNVEDTNKIKAIHIQANVTKCALVNGSSYKNTPSTSIIVGAIYCKIPAKDKGI